MPCKILILIDEEFTNGLLLLSQNYISRGKKTGWSGSRVDLRNWWRNITGNNVVKSIHSIICLQTNYEIFLKSCEIMSIIAFFLNNPWFISQKLMIQVKLCWARDLSSFHAASDEKDYFEAESNKQLVISGFFLARFILLFEAYMW